MNAAQYFSIILRKNIQHNKSFLQSQKYLHETISEEDICSDGKLKIRWHSVSSN